MYNLPTNIGGFGELSQYIFGIDSNFFNFFFIVIWLLGFLILKSSPLTSVAKAFTSISITSFILALTLLPLGIISYKVIFFMLIFTGIGIVWVMRENKE
jgi:hypothetical protein